MSAGSGTTVTSIMSSRLMDETEEMLRSQVEIRKKREAGQAGGAVAG